MTWAAENLNFGLTFQQFLKKLMLKLMTNRVSPLSSVLLQKQIDYQLAKKFPLFMEPNALFPNSLSNDAVNCPYVSQMRVRKSFITVRLQWNNTMKNRRLNYDKRLRRFVKENRTLFMTQIQSLKWELVKKQRRFRL
jgi:hypothetical protein